MGINNPNSSSEGSNKTSILSNGILSLAMLTQVAVADTIQAKEPESTRDIPVEKLIRMYPNTMYKTIISLSKEKRKTIIEKGGGLYGKASEISCARCHYDIMNIYNGFKKEHPNYFKDGISQTEIDDREEKYFEAQIPFLRTAIHTLKYESPEPLKQKHLEEFAPMYNNNPAKWTSGEYYNVPAAGRLKEGSINTTNGEFRRHIERAFTPLKNKDNFKKLKSYLSYFLGE